MHPERNGSQPGWELWSRASCTSQGCQQGDSMSDIQVVNCVKICAQSVKERVEFLQYAYVNTFVNSLGIYCCDFKSS